MRNAVRASIFASIIIATSLLGFAREVIIARLFGIGSTIDCFIAAFVIVWFLATILSPHTMQALFMPGYQEERRHGNKRASELFHNMALLIAGLTLCVTVACYMLAPQIIALLMPGFHEQEIVLSTALMRIMLPLIVIHGLCNLAQALCHSHENFIMPISSHFVHNVLLLMLLALAPTTSVHTLSQYYLYSGLVSALILIPSYTNLMPQIHINLRNHTYLRVFAAGSPLLLLGFLDQFAQMIPRSFASLLSDGDIAALNYAFRLVVLPVAVIALTISSFLFPRIIEATRTSKDEVRAHLAQGTGLLLYALAPAALFLSFKSHRIVEILFSSDAFTPDAIERTASAMHFYAIGMVGLGYMMLLNRVYSAYKDYKAYMHRILLSYIALGLGSWLLITPLGSDGPALAFSIYSYVACLLLVAGLHKRGIKHLISMNMLITLLLGLLPSALMLHFWQATHLAILMLQAALCMSFMSVALWLRRDPVLGLIGLPTPQR